MYYSAEQTQRICAEQSILRSGESSTLTLCQYKNLSCVRCCLPHIGGDSHLADQDEEGLALANKSVKAGLTRFSSRYLGPRKLMMKFRNFNPLTDPRIEASGYEDSFPDVGKDEMERRFTARRRLFLDIYDGARPRPTLTRYMEAAQENEGYRYKPTANAGPVSIYLGGSVPKHFGRGELPECQLLGFADGGSRVGCMAHPMAETSRGHDGRDQVGFFNHSGCCASIECEASAEFRFLSNSALRVFDKAVEGMSWYEFSRHSTSVLVYYLRSYDPILKKLDERKLLETISLKQLVEFSNALYDEWPLRESGASENDPVCSAAEPMDFREILSMGIPTGEKIMHVALGTRFTKKQVSFQLKLAEENMEKRIAEFCHSHYC